jgi:AhpD family alkylhydroperoxidase
MLANSGGCRDALAPAMVWTKRGTMTENWLGITKEMSAAVKELRVGTPNVMKSFSALAHAALEPKVLDIKTKELIALAISVATRCAPCIAFHAESAVKQGATRDEVMETMGMAVYMGAGPSVMYAAQAVEAYDQFKDQLAQVTAD